MASEWRTATVLQLVDEGILERPIDGNHGEIHPKTGDFVKSGIPFIMASDLVHGRVDTTSCAFISERQARTLRKGFAKPGDVLISHKASMGRTAIVEQGGTPFLMLTPQVTYYRVKAPSRLSNRYLKLYFDSPRFQQLFETWGQKGSTRAYLGITSQLDLPILIPPVTEQRVIAHILGTLDDKIELNRRTNETLEAMAQAIFKSWFVDFDPVHAKAKGRAPAGLSREVAALFPDSFQDSPLGLIPKGWAVETILATSSLISGGTPKTSEPGYWGGSIPWASAKDVSQCQETFLITTERCITDLGLSNSATRIVNKYSTAVVARGATTGRMAMFGDAIAMNQTCYALSSRIGCSFFAYCQARDVVSRLVHGGHGSVFNTITTETFAATPVLLPGVQLAGAFEKIVTPLFLSILNRQHESRSLEALRVTLLPKLLSGELRIADPEKFLASSGVPL